MSTEENKTKNHQPSHNDNIPRWFYNTVISMGIMVFVAFGLIILGSL